MKAIVQSRYGPPETLAFADIERPAVADKEVLVGVKAVGLNWADSSVMRGVPYVLRLGYGIRQPRSRVRGMDISGVVAGMGRRVTGFRIGDEVFGSNVGGGGLAEVAAVPSKHLVSKPPNVSHEQAAAIPVAGCTALQGLGDRGRLTKGQRVLITGASGGVGSFAVQIAKSFGAEVTGVCSTRNLDLVKSLGADHVIDYTVEDFTQGEPRFDLVLDNVASHSLRQARRVLVPGGKLIPNSGLELRSGRTLGGVGRMLAALTASAFIRKQGRPYLSLSKPADLKRLVAMVAEGTLAPVIGRTFGLSDAAEAMRNLESRHAQGKVVVTV